MRTEHRERYDPTAVEPTSATGGQVEGEVKREQERLVALRQEEVRMQEKQREIERLQQQQRAQEQQQREQEQQQRLRLLHEKVLLATFTRARGRTLGTCGF
jgi:hypothetical protein